VQGKKRAAADTKESSTSGLMKDFVKLDKKLSLLNLNQQSSKSFLAAQQK